MADMSACLPGISATTTNSNDNIFGALGYGQRNKRGVSTWNLHLSEGALGSTNLIIGLCGRSVETFTTICLN